MSYAIEEETGTFDRALHRHNGYYAGDFWSTPTRVARDQEHRARQATVRLPARLSR